ncbi:FHA domain-containing protein FhaB/FipA [Rarobacter incanus]|uniref:Type III secretion system (T3SS) inner membrane Yop/YscD-like protein n=1 Tax=Rarobacter incanus TaxID=153494 RepID=A0A542SPV4_9MICO|nr:FHA domain-containing protein [Rarobacter incanus]TQK76650.1 type III secretion system (T3SS) inner membrane Yop/YscD-like protein [Rarobacter incanus]
MNELTMTILRIAYLVAMWLFVLAVISVLRRDLYGTRISPRRQGHPVPGPVDAAPRRQPHPDSRHLVVTAGPLEGTTLPLGNVSVMIGRAPDCTLVVNDDYASSRHARIYPHDGTWFVEDLGSTNGTKVGGHPLERPEELPLDTPLQIGQSVIELRK